MTAPAPVTANATESSIAKPQLWDHQPGESPNAFAIFEEYRQLGPDITLKDFADKTNRSLDAVQNYSCRHHWRERAAAWRHHLAIVRSQAAEQAAREIPGATAGFLEFTGQGLTSFERALDRDERLMAVLGSRLLEDQKKVGETAEAIELRQSGENSVLSSIAASVSESLTQILRWVYWWNSTQEVPDDVSESQVLVKLNTDFSLKGMSSQDLQAIVKAWQANAISRDTMLELFRKGEILPDGRTNEEEERKLILKELKS